MIVNPTKIEGVYVVDAEPVKDHRGFFMRAFCRRELEKIIGDRDIVQVNQSRTETRGAIRGLHYQNAPHAEMKLVRCVKGRLFDVVVDLRPESETYLQYHAEELSPENAKMVVVPEGCAHGFQSLEDGSEIVYLVTAFYNKEFEGCVRYNDPAFGIEWPLQVADISERDKTVPLIDVSNVDVLRSSAE